MICAELRASGAGFDPKAFIDKADIYPDTVFENGFSACLVDSANKGEFIQQLAEAVDKWRDVFKELSESGIEIQIDIGATVGTEEQFTCSIALPVQVVKALTDQGIQIVFSAYPASD